MMMMMMKWTKNNYSIKKTRILEVNMPIYEFKCKKCEIKYDLLCSYDESGKYPKVKCPECGSKKKDKMVSIFNSSCGGNPKGTKREDSFSYMAGHNMEGARPAGFGVFSEMGNNYLYEIDLFLDYIYVFPFSAIFRYSIVTVYSYINI